MEPEDCAAIVVIQSASWEASHWSAADYEDLASRSRTGWVAEEIGSEPKTLAGFIVVGHAADEMEILSLAVAPAHRRRGVARMLLAEAKREGREAGARTIWLEVRSSNENARRFYEATGFSVAGRRPKYYRNPDEDALTLTATIGPT
jgi:ribosomal-protein-alanine N-acetyltransferase